MTDIVNPILQTLNANPHLSGLITFLISAAESIAIVGTIIPGTIMMTAIGTLAGAGVIPLWPTIIWAILGAVVGDGISYWFGHHYKERLRYVWPFQNNPNWLKAGETFFYKHGSKSVFLGRFVGPVRAIVPLVAGMLGMKPLRFYLANIISAIGWAPAYMLPGILLGAASLELPPDIAVHVILMLLLAGLFLIFCAWVIYKILILISNQIDNVLTQIWNKLNRSKFGSIVTLALKHHNPSKTHGQLILAFYFCLVTTAFLFLYSAVSKYGADSFLINRSAYYLFRSFRTPEIDPIMLFITNLGDSRVLIPVMLLIFVFLFYNNYRYTAWHVLALTTLAILGVEVYKHYLHSLRPWGIIQSPKGYSFPSGHTLFATTFYFGLALLLNKAFQNKNHWPVRFALLITLLVGISRLYLGAHWLTDVLAGWLLGAAILMIIVISYNRTKEKISLDGKGILATTFLSLLIMLSSYSLFTYHHLSNAYSLKPWPSYTVSVDEWWDRSNPHVPYYRINRFGIAYQLLNLQWLGSLEQIKNLLLKNDWEVPPERNWISVLLRLTDIQSSEQLPLVSPLYLDQKPSLVLIKRPQNGIKNTIVLRLWDSKIIIQPEGQKLWVGTLEFIPRTYSWLMRKKPQIFTITPEILFNHNQKDYFLKTHNVPEPIKNKHTGTAMLLLKPK